MEFETSNSSSRAHKHAYYWFSRQSNTAGDVIIPALGRFRNASGEMNASGMAVLALTKVAAWIFGHMFFISIGII
jgi:hypothetical protein